MNSHPVTPAGSGTPYRDPETIFQAALQLQPDRRLDFLRASCGDDKPLQAQLEDRLHAHEESATTAERQQTHNLNKTLALRLQAEEQVGDRIGPYRILQLLGEGGCGVVYMAEQEQPIRRRVALKIIKLGMDTKQVVARFEAERQALALMDHANICRVFDAGATNTGRPFFVMELVRGVKITDYCDQNKLSLEQRLSLFVHVCQAIQHAHQKGIIHRDIKPSNVLVTLQDNIPVPKVIDFGIAKATGQQLTEKTVFTAVDQFVGTPAYMSPEQASLTGLDLDTRTDIYSLGVLLYELLTGQPPFDTQQLVNCGLEQLLVAICEKEPERPSTRLRTLAAAELRKTAGNYRIEGPKLIFLLRGDLDWIVMKALEKDRTRRYQTASALASDLQHYLNNEPVEARPPSLAYQIRKLIRKNRVVFLAGAAVVMALALGFGISTVLFVREHEARKRAAKAEENEAFLRKKAETAFQLEVEKRERAQLGEKIGLAALYLTQDRYPEAEMEISQVPLSTLTNFISTAFLFNALGEKQARHGQWQDAITNFTKLIAIVPSDFRGYRALGSLYAQAGDTNNFYSMIARASTQFGQTSDEDIAAWLVLESLLLPVPSASSNATAKWLETAGRAANSARSRVAASLSAYRTGNYPAALGCLQDIKSTSDPESLFVEVHMLAAMSEFKLQRFTEAENDLQAGSVAANRNLPTIERGLGPDWPDWIAAHRLMQEATALITAPPK